MSIYVDEVGKSLRAKYLLRYSKRFDEIWADVPTGETRYAKLRDIVSAHSDAARNPVSLLGYYDCVSTPRAGGRTEAGAGRTIWRFCQTS